MSKKTIEERLDILEQRIDRILEMVQDIHAHVGFVQKLSDVFENIKNSSLILGSQACRLIGF